MHVCSTFSTMHAYTLSTSMTSNVSAVLFCSCYALSCMQSKQETLIICYTLYPKVPLQSCTVACK